MIPLLMFSCIITVAFTYSVTEKDLEQIRDQYQSISKVDLHPPRQVERLRNVESSETKNESVLISAHELLPTTCYGNHILNWLNVRKCSNYLCKLIYCKNFKYFDYACVLLVFFRCCAVHTLLVFTSLLLIITKYNLVVTRSLLLSN